MNPKYSSDQVEGADVNDFKPNSEVQYQGAPERPLNCVSFK